MEMSSSQWVPVSQEITWAALNDPQVLKGCITGCESIDRLSDTEYAIALAVKVGPVNARFKGKMSLADLNPPESYAIVFEGQGGAAGFARGTAAVRLAPEEAGTRLTYDVKAQIGGKLAQIGARLIDGVAKKMADEFFAAFVKALSPPVESAATTEETPPADEAPAGSRWRLWKRA